MPVRLKVGLWGPLGAPGAATPESHVRVELEVELDRVRGASHLQEQVRFLLGQLRTAVGDEFRASRAQETASVPARALEGGPDMAGVPAP
jgi:hypothetical protein